MSQAKPNQPNQPKQDRDKGQSPDPYLRAFLRQAVAIVAAERGFNERCQAKLQLLATQLGLSDQTFHEAVEKLKQPNNSFGLKRYEKRFVEYLVNQFELIHGDVLNIKAEKKLVDLAARKYQIDSVRAHQLILMTAEQNGVATISHVDAEQYARQLVEDAVGDSTELASQDQEKLVQACVKWGFSDIAARQLLGSLLRKNTRRRRRRLALQTCCLLFSLAIVSAVTWAVFQVDWEQLLAANSTRPSSVAGVSVEADKRLPAWWNDRLAKCYLNLSGRTEVSLNVVETTADPDSSDLSAAYRKLAEVVLSSRNTESTLEQYVAMLYAMDPANSNVDPVRKLIAQGLKTGSETEPMLPSRLRRAQRANRLLGTMLTFCSDQPNAIAPRRLEQLHSIHQRTFGIALPSNSSLDQYLSDTQPMMAIEHWSHALRFANSHPKKIAGLLPELEKLVASSEPGINEFRTEVAQVIANRVPIQWSTIRNSINASINQGGTADVTSWYEVYRSTDSQSLAKFLINRLGSKLNVDPNAGQDAVLDRLHDFRMRTKVPNFEIAKAANDQLVQELPKLRDAIMMAGVSWKGDEIRLHSDSDTLKILGKVAHGNNLLLAWIRGYEQKQSFDLFDQVTRNADFPSLRFNIEPILRSPTPSQKRQLDESFDRLFNSQPNQVSARMSALNAIRDVANVVDDLDYKTSKSLTAYLFRDKEARESLAADRALEDMKHWSNLKLAIADYVAVSTVQLDSVLNLLSRLGLDNIEVVGDEWKKIVQQAVLEQSADKLAKQNRQRFEQIWQPVQNALKAKLEERVRILSAGRVRPSRDNFPNNWLEGLQDCYSDESGPVENQLGREMFQRRLGMIQANRSHFQRLRSGTILLAEKYEDDYRDLLPGERVNTTKVVVQNEETENDLLVAAQQILISELRLHDVLSRIRQAMLSDWN